MTKKKFSKTWKRSKKPSKQRLYRHNAPKHIKGKFLSAHLNETLKEKYGKRNMRLRKGDTVKVMRGDHQGTEGDIQEVYPDQEEVIVENVERNREDGSKIKPPLKPSNLKIVSLNKEDTARMEKIGGEAEKEEKESDKEKDKSESKESSKKKKQKKDKKSKEKKSSKSKKGSKKSGSKKKKDSKSKKKKSKSKSKSKKKSKKEDNK